MKKTKVVYVLLYLGDYYDEFETFEEARSVKEDYNSWFGQNSEIKTKRVRI